MGRHQLRLLKFALRYPNEWHSYGSDRSTVNAVRALARLELLELSPVSRQFRLKTGTADNYKTVKV
jgi:hypothetical protein